MGYRLTTAPVNATRALIGVWTQSGALVQPAGAEFGNGPAALAVLATGIPRVREPVGSDARR